MELKQKGQETFIPLMQLMATMKWTTAADFDLAALYETADGKTGLVYFGDRGDKNAFPYIHLNEDSGVGDKGGDNEEVLFITRLDDIKNVWIFCWDYNRAQKGETARFTDSDIQIIIEENTGKAITVKLDSIESGNIACIAHINNSNSEGARLINMSKVATLNGLKTLDQLTAIVR
ncbi:MAG: hypothetical protein RIT27_611 [Pseudomonadota bacterium]|jgi:tellurite resistance protein TerA